MPDQMAPSAGQKVAPDGTVTYEFEGHLIAQGLDLLASQQTTPPADRRIVWKREDNGAIAATIHAYAPGPPETLQHLAFAVDTPSTADGEGYLDLLVETGGGSLAAQLELFHRELDGYSFVRAQTRNGHVRTVIDSLGQSGFLQLAVPAARQLALAGVPTGNIPAGGSVGVWLEWDVPFPDANYFVVWGYLDSNARSQIRCIDIQDPDAVHVVVDSNSGAATSGDLFVVGIG